MEFTPAISLVAMAFNSDTLYGRLVSQTVRFSVS